MARVATKGYLGTIVRYPYNVEILRYPASRLHRFTDFTEGNPLTSTVLNKMANVIPVYQKSPIVSLFAVSPNTKNKGLFSKGLLRDENFKETFEAAQNLSTELHKYDKYSLVLFDGHVRNAAFSVFSSSTYRYGSPEMTFSINEMKDGHFPIGGGLFWSLVDNNTNKIPIARFMGLSGYVMQVNDMLKLGYINGVSNTVSLLNMLESFIHGVTEDYEGYQTHPADFSELPMIMSTFNINDNPFGSNLLSNGLFKKTMTITPSDAYGNKPVQVNKELDPECMALVMKAFEFNNYSETLDYLNKLTKSLPELGAYGESQLKLVRFLLKKLNKVDKKMAQEWYDLTKSAVNMPYLKALEIERKYL